MGMHPESPLRLVAIKKVLEKLQKDTALIELDSFSDVKDAILRVHTQSHYERVKATDGKTRCYLDMGDTMTSPDSYLAACHAVGASLRGIDAMMNNEIDNGFLFLRPPGHHAERNRPMGFCLFNNIAIAAQYAIDRYNLERVLIVDWDVHHGNGTQEIFYTTEKVLYFSTHQSPHFPGTGDFYETGSGDGAGYTVNVPVPPGTGDDEYLAIYQHILRPIALDFKPQLVLISAGFDPHEKDPLAGVHLTTTCFADLTKIILSIADASCAGKALVFLEGGYNLDVISAATRTVMHVLLDDSPEKRTLSRPVDKSAIRAIINTVGRFHPNVL
jgi:acetoin utilization deacetylase AcuC-like enzyme